MGPHTRRRSPRSRWPRQAAGSRSEHGGERGRRHGDHDPTMQPPALALRAAPAAARVGRSTSPAPPLPGSERRYSERFRRRTVSEYNNNLNTPELASGKIMLFTLLLVASASPLLPATHHDGIVSADMPVHPEASQALVAKATGCPAKMEGVLFSHISKSRVLCGSN